MKREEMLERLIVVVDWMTRLSADHPERIRAAVMMNSLVGVYNELKTAPLGNENQTLPCDVILPAASGGGGMRIGKNCPVSTLELALHNRRQHNKEMAEQTPEQAEAYRLAGIEFRQMLGKQPSVRQRIDKVVRQRLGEPITRSSVDELLRAINDALPIGFGWDDEQPQGGEWVQAQQVADQPQIDEMIRALVDDATNDNAVMLVREIIRVMKGRE